MPTHSNCKINYTLHSSQEEILNKKSTVQFKYEKFTEHARQERHSNKEPIASKGCKTSTILAITVHHFSTS